MSKSSVVLATVIFAGGWGRMAMAVEEPKFEVVEDNRDFEIRRYADTVVAETNVDGDFKGAGNEAFRRLAGSHEPAKAGRRRRAAAEDV